MCSLIARMGLIFITAMPAACGKKRSPAALPERQNFVVFRLSGGDIVCFSSADNASLACGYESLAFQAIRHFIRYSLNIIRKKARSFSILFLCAVFFVFCNGIQAQNTIGRSEIINYTSEANNTGAQNWMIAQDKFGIMYFANSDGLVSFDGHTWKTFPLPNKTVVRSIFIGADGKIFIGGQNELGYFFPSENGSLQYHSLKNLLPEKDRSFSDIWNIEIAGNDIFFRSGSNIFRINLKTNTSESYAPLQEWAHLCMVNGVLYAEDRGSGLFYFENNKWHFFTDALKDDYITYVGQLDSGLIITTLKNGVFVLNNKKQLRLLPIDEKIINDHIHNAIKTGNEFALATTSDGIYFISKEGKTTKHISTNSGLQNDNVLSLFEDKQKNIWAGLDNGIDVIDNNSAIDKISPTTTNPFACYTAQIFDGKLYIGTSDGLYFTKLTASPDGDISFSKGNFSRVNNSQGQVWTLFSEGGKLLMGHTDGAFAIENNTANPVYKNSGAWLFKFINGKKNIVFGTYNGLQWLNTSGFSPDTANKTGINESLRFLEIDSANHIIWAAHPYKGVYKIRLDETQTRIISYKLYTGKDGLPSDINNYVYHIGNQIVFCTENGIYNFDAAKDRFVRNTLYEKIFGNIPVRLVEEDSSQNLWFVSGRKVGVVTGNHHLQFIPEASGKTISGFEFIYPYNRQNIFIGSSNGLIHVNFPKYLQTQAPIELLLSNVTAIGKKDSVLFNGYFTKNNSIVNAQPPDKIYELNAGANSFHFEFTVTNYKKDNDILYSYRLVGFDNEWSAPSARNDKDYTNLPYGKYTFKVRAGNSFGKESNIVEYTFVILPHWYQTKIAYAFYLMSVVLLFIFLYLFQKNNLKKQKEKYEQEQAHQAYIHQLELEHNEREILQLQQENLKNEVAYKNKELASTTMHLYKRGKILSKLKQELSDSINTFPAKDKHKDELSRLVKMLNEEEKKDNDWEQFSIHFDEVHNNFLENLKRKYPELTQADLKICAYTKMNLSVKDTAQLLYITPKSVEIARYRLRKKLGINSSDTSLYEFLVEKGGR